MPVAMALGSLQICTDLIEPLWPVIAVSTEVKYFGLFDFYALLVIIVSFSFETCKEFIGYNICINDIKCSYLACFM